MTSKIKQKILNKQNVAGVIGFGYVGLPLAMLIARKEFKVYVFDIDKHKVCLLRDKKSYISHISSEEIEELKPFFPTYNFSKLRYCDIIVICVPIPTTESNEPELAAVINTAETIARYLRKRQLVVLESTTYPTTTRNVVKPIPGKTGLKCGKDFYLAFSPKREDSRRKDYTTETIPKVVGSVEKLQARLQLFFIPKWYKKVIPVIFNRIC